MNVPAGPVTETHYVVRDASTADSGDVKVTDYGAGKAAFAAAKQAATMLPQPGRELDFAWFEVTYGRCYPVMADDPGPVT